MSREFSIEVVQKLTQAGFTAYWAGGCVRDLLRGVEPHDFDVATNARPEQIRQIFGRGRTLAVGENFGVMIVLSEKTRHEQVEVATFRQEGDYHDGRHPGRVEFCTAEEDALRRDFTINGMFFDPLHNIVHDFVGGQADLSAKIVRAIGNPRDRMTEDKLRMLRAARFTAALGFELDPATAEAIAALAPELHVVSVERIAQEMRRMLLAPQRALAMHWLLELGLLDQFLPEVRTFSFDIHPERWTQILTILKHLQLTRFEPALAALLRDVPVGGNESCSPPSGTIRAICQRLKLSREETDWVCQLASQRGIFQTLPLAPAAPLKRLAVHRMFPDLFQLERIAAEVEELNLEPFTQVEQKLAGWSPEELNPPALLTGRDLLKLGLKSGPEFKLWLDQIRDAQLNGDIRTSEQARQQVLHWAGQPQPEPQPEPHSEPQSGTQS